MDGGDSAMLGGLMEKQYGAVGSGVPGYNNPQQIYRLPSPAPTQSQKQDIQQLHQLTSELTVQATQLIQSQQQTIVYNSTFIDQQMQKIQSNNDKLMAQEIEIKKMQDYVDEMAQFENTAEQ